MAYHAATLPGPGVLLMTSPKTEPLWDRLLDDGIAVSTVNPFTHSALVVGQPGRLRIVEALFRVTESPLDKYEATGWYYPLSPTASQSRMLEATAMDHMGQLYGASMVWQDFVRDDLHIDIHPRIDPAHLDCSGLVCLCCVQAGMPLTRAPVPSPADVSYSIRLPGPRPWAHS